MMWWNGGGWWWLAMISGMAVFWGLVAWAVLSVVRTGRAGPDRPDAEAALADRYARGEIDTDDYRARLGTLRSHGPHAGRSR